MLLIASAFFSSGDCTGFVDSDDFVDDLLEVRPPAGSDIFRFECIFEASLSTSFVLVVNVRRALVDDISGDYATFFFLLFSYKTSVLAHLKFIINST